MAFIGLELYDEGYNCGPTVFPESGKSFNEICTLGHQQWQPTTLPVLSGLSSESSATSSSPKHHLIMNTWTTKSAHWAINNEDNDNEIWAALL